MIPTSLGIALARGYCEIDPELVFPQMRSNIEKSCGQIAMGEAKFEDVLEHVTKCFKEKYRHFVLNSSTMETIMRIQMTQSDSNKLDLNISDSLTKDVDIDKSIPQHDRIRRNMIMNFCIKCFKGFMQLENEDDKHMFRCSKCSFKVLNFF